MSKCVCLDWVICGPFYFSFSFFQSFSLFERRRILPRAAFPYPDRSIPRYLIPPTMPPPHHLSLVHLFAFLLLSSSSLSPLTHALATTHLTNLTDASSSSLLPTYNYNCIPRRWYQRSAPTFSACQAAILHLPGDAERGTFHNGRPLDRFWMPKTKTCLECAVTVRFEDDSGGGMVTASWSLVRDRALRLAEQ